MTLRILQGILVVMFIILAILLCRDVYKNREALTTKNKIINFFVAIALNALGTMGIGSFATTTAFYRLTGMVEDKKIPGTLVVGCMLPVIVQGLSFMTAVEVDIFTLVCMLICSTIGAFIGSKINQKMPVKGIRLTVAMGLLVAGILLLGTLLSFLPAGGDKIGLTGMSLVFSCFVIFILGVLYPLGIGSYAPTLVLVSLMGMNPAVAFPIMMCGAAFNGASSFINFIKSGEFHHSISFIFNLGGIIGVSMAVMVVISLPINVLKWVVLVVVLYTSFSMFKSVMKKA